MAMIIEEAAKLSNDVLLVGVVEMIIKDSPVLQSLPFIEIVGNGLTYNQEKTLGSINFYDVGDPWAESTPTFEQITATLKIMGGDADVDNFLKTTRSNINDLEATVMKMKAKALAQAFEQTFIYGDSAVNPKQFDGLRKLINPTAAGSQVMETAASVAGGAGGALALTDIDHLIDAVKGGKPDALLMSKRSRRAITVLARVAGFPLGSIPGPLGGLVPAWNEIPLWASDYVLDTHVVASHVETADMTTGASSAIYAFQLGEGALAGLTAPGHITVDPIGVLETKDATRTRIKWYVSLALFASIKAAVLIGVQ